MNQTSSETARAVVGAFAISGELVAIEAFERGHIHDTFVSTWQAGDARQRFLHQRMNDQVFRDLPALMNNIERVTRHLATHDGELHTLRLVPTRGGESWLSGDHGAWRTYVFIEGTKSHDLCDRPELAYDAAHAFGSFQKRLADLDASVLRETIPEFFSSSHRLRQFDAALDADVAKRRHDAAVEIGFAQRRRAMCDVFDRMLRDGRMPKRVVHGDTKLNNVLFCTKSHRPVCVVDLDTCMPGWSLYDFGDLVRFTAATAPEDETDLDKVGTDLDLYEALVQGYLDTAGEFLGDEEIGLMPLAARLVTFTVGLRFLTDHLAGDTYFKVARPGHNLERARVQFRMVECMERFEGRMVAALPRAARVHATG